LAIDASDNVWTANFGGKSISEFTSAGVPLSPSPSGIGQFGNPGGFPVGSYASPYGIAIDASNNIWVANYSGYAAELNDTGTLLFPNSNPGAAGYINVSNASGVVISNPANIWFNVGYGLNEVTPSGTYVQQASSTGTYEDEAAAADGAGTLWVASLGAISTSYNAQNISAFSSSGALLTPPAGLHSNYMSEPNAIAVDGSGNVWVADYYYTDVVEFIGAAVPVVTPLSAGVKNNTIASRP
jgi:ligand-binding sensor domain-containing protein